MPTLMKRHDARASRLLSLALLTFSTAAFAQADDAIRPDATMLMYPAVSAENIAFVYANDMWVVPRAGGVARKIASPPGREGFPTFSPDGSEIAFLGNYEGNSDIYIVPVNGAAPAFRVTHHPGTEFITQWSADGRIVYHLSGKGGLARQTQLFTVTPDGGLPEQLPVPYGANGQISPDGEWLAYQFHTRDFRTWKRYRGGMATDIWLFNLKTNESRQITDWEGTDTLPMWHRTDVYYLSDAGDNHRLNIWKYDTRNGRRSQVTNFDEFDVKWPSIGPGDRGQGEIVFQNGSRVHLLDLRTQRSRPIDIIIPGDRPTLRPQQVDYAQFIASGSVSPEGERVVVEARGDIWSLPAEKGITRNLTRTSGIAERNPIWSPNGRWIAYLSDETGEYEIYITQSDGRGETRQLTDNGEAYRYLESWSPDSKHILFSDKTGSIYLLNVDSKEQTHVATDAWGARQPVSWSHDSAWLTFALSNEANSQGVVHVYNIESGELTALTSPMFSDANPVFDRRGRFMYFVSNRRFSPQYSSIDTTFIYPDSQVILAVPLNSDVENPWLLKSDEVKWEEDEEEADDAEDNGNADDADAQTEDADDENADDDADPTADFDTEHPLFGKWAGKVFGPEMMGFPAGGMDFEMTILVTKEGVITGTSTSQGETQSYDSIEWNAGTRTVTFKSSTQGITVVSTATLDGDKLDGQWSIDQIGMSGTWNATRTSRELDAKELDEARKAADKDEAKPVVIDFEGFEARAMMIGVAPGSFGNLGVNDKNQLLYIRRGDGIKLYDIEKNDEGEKAVLPGGFGFMITADGKKMAVMGGGGIAVVNTAPGQSMAKRVPTNMMKGQINPREEWEQLFMDAWRIQRDFFYDPGLHKVDWEAARDRYKAMLRDAVTREDVSYIIGEMIGEFNVGHAYYWGGDVERTPFQNVGMLGVDYELATEDDHTAFRIARIYEGAAWDADARNPLRAPGVDVTEGMFLLEVNGMPLDTNRNPFVAFVGLAGQMTELTVSEKPYYDDDARRVLVNPLGSEQNHRYRAWIERNRQYVYDQTDGKVGYIYVPNTGVDGQNDLFRQFYGQRHMDGLVIDERWNGGGQIPTRFIELLNRPRTNYWARRDGKDWPWPPDSHQGPKVMLINGLAGSGGDMFPALFRQAGLGKLVGTRTWGGLVGISGNPSLIDGGYTAVPTFGFYTTEGRWSIEGHGVDPDIEVIDDPAKMISKNGELADPQLDAAIEQVMKEIRENPYIPPQRPAGPDRSGMGLPANER